MQKGRRFYVVEDIFPFLACQKYRISEKKNILIEDLDDWKDCFELEGSLYALPLVSGEQFHGALILFRNSAI